ncbi:MAG: YifB family Mg chelatase-like AAA ATPase [Actinomycetota bacterium]
MLAKTETVAIVGAEAALVVVEVHSAEGVPGVSIVGLPTKSVREAEHRTKSALVSAGHRWPKRRITANLAPGGLRKDGPHFDLALALGVLATDGQLEAAQLEGWVALGELGLDGSVRPVRGILSAAIACRSGGRRGLICASQNAPEAAIVDGINVVPVGSLRDCIEVLRGEREPATIPPAPAPSLETHLDLREVRGHASAKRALEVAAAGGHNLLLTGPPGSGKSMLAQRMPGILPEMSLDESFEVTRVHSVAGLLGERASLVTARPFRTPHHHVSLAGLMGGGAGLARPGEISLAHHGVLFLDELTLYARNVLESLRAPLEDGVVHIARSGGSLTFPCRFTLIGAMNPCPCGFRGDATRECRCSLVQLASHGARLSGPLIDRFDLQMTMGRVGKTELMGPPDGETSEEVRKRVEAARFIQADRYGSSLETNASAANKLLEDTIALDPGVRPSLGVAIDALRLSGRGLDRVLRIARTLADLAGREVVSQEHIDEAIFLRAAVTDGGLAA